MPNGANCRTTRLPNSANAKPREYRTARVPNNAGVANGADANGATRVEASRQGFRSDVMV
jgi:hypothetical protein